MNQGIFVTATGTDVGKTYVSGLLVKALRARGINAGYFKPALSGAEREGGRLVPGDARWVCRTAGLPGDPADYVAYLYEQAVSPHLAARLEGPPIELAAILERQRAVGERFAYLVAEGCGGLFCPLREGEPPLLLADVAAAIGFDLLLVAPSGLGAIHAAVVTAAYAERLGLPVRGILLNRFDEENISSGQPGANRPLYRPAGGGRAGGRCGVGSACLAALNGEKDKFGQLKSENGYSRRRFFHI